MEDGGDGVRTHFSGCGDGVIYPRLFEACFMDNRPLSSVIWVAKCSRDKVPRVVIAAEGGRQFRCRSSCATDLNANEARGCGSCCLATERVVGFSFENQCAQTKMGCKTCRGIQNLLQISIFKTLKCGKNAGAYLYPSPCQPFLEAVLTDGAHTNLPAEFPVLEKREEQGTEGQEHHRASPVHNEPEGEVRVASAADGERGARLQSCVCVCFCFGAAETKSNIWKLGIGMRARMGKKIGGSFPYVLATPVLPKNHENPNPGWWPEPEGTPLAGQGKHDDGVDAHCEAPRHEQGQDAQHGGERHPHQHPAGRGPGATAGCGLRIHWIAILMVTIISHWLDPLLAPRGGSMVPPDWIEYFTPSQIWTSCSYQISIISYIYHICHISHMIICVYQYITNIIYHAIHRILYHMHHISIISYISCICI